MHEDRRAVRRTPPVRLVIGALLVTVLAGGCTSPSDGNAEAGASPSPTTTQLAEVDLTGVVAARTAFCDALDPASVVDLLGGEAEATDTYESGQRVEVAPGLRDVANEYSCKLERDDRTARAWLFAQSVSPEQARGWVRELSADERCRPAGELSFGDPGLVQSCGQDDRRRVTAAGLFGDGWLTCQATAPRAVDEAELLELTQRWCAEVAQTTAP